MIDKDEYIKRANYVHNNFYTYGNYEGMGKKVEIICPKHGLFLQSAQNHINGCGCPKCAKEEKENKYKNGLIERFKQIHGLKYDYSKVILGKSNEKVLIICPIHGEFKQTPSKHLQGQGCPLCGVIERTKKKTFSKDDFLLKAPKEYDYSSSIYVKMHEKIEVICKKHGTFKIRPYDLLNGHGCPKCGYNKSKGEEEIYDFVCNIVGKENVIQKDRTILKGKELDIFIPNKHLAIEFNGTIWHSSKYGKDKNYHLNKTEECLKQGIRLIHVFEYDWKINKDEILTKIKYFLKGEGNVETVLDLKFDKNKDNTVITCKLDRKFGDKIKDNKLVELGFKLKEIIEPQSRIVDGKYKIWDCGYYLYEKNNKIK